MDLNISLLDGIMAEDVVENGAWLHLDNPVTGEPLFAGADLPSEIRVRSHRSKTFQSAQFAKEANQAVAKKNRARTPNDIIRESLEVDRPRNFSLLVTGWRNLGGEPGKVYEPTKPELVALVRDKPNLGWMVDQVLNFAFRDDGFGGNGEPDSSGSETAS